MRIEDTDAPGPLPEPDLTPQPGDCREEADDAPVVEHVAYLGFIVGHEMYGVPLEQLREVARLKRLRRIPGAPLHVAGLMNLRGEIVCALDTRAILALPDAPLPGGGYLIALRGFPDPLGLVVDSIADVYGIDPAAIEPTPGDWPAARAALCVGIARRGQDSIALLDVHRMAEVTA
jgi:purine-binding chemotaxis protein CheW